MRRTICCAIFGLLVSGGAVFPQWHASPRSWGRPRVRVIGVRWFAAPPAVFFRYCPSVPVPYPVLDPVPYPVWDFIAPWPTYVFVGSASATHPQLVFKDRTTYTVTDYWRVNDELHFITLEESGTKSVPHTLPFGDLDVQQTTEVNSAQGFRFMLRDEPIEQWLEHRAQQHAPRGHRNNGGVN
jgi:hypothetical protein